MKILAPLRNIICLIPAILLGANNTAAGAVKTGKSQAKEQRKSIREKRQSGYTGVTAQVAMSAVDQNFEQSLEEELVSNCQLSVAIEKNLPYCRYRKKIVQTIIYFEYENCRFEGCCFPCYENGILHKVFLYHPEAMRHIEQSAKYANFLKICSWDGYDWHEWYNFISKEIAEAEKKIYYVPKQELYKRLLKHAFSCLSERTINNTGGFPSLKKLICHPYK